MVGRQRSWRSVLRWLAWLVLAALVAGCTAQGAQPSGGAAPYDLGGSEWVLVELDGQPVLAGVEVTARFVNGNEIGGSAGCNSYGGAFRADPAAGRFATDRLAQTEMACLSPDGVMEQERAYMDALQDAAAYRVVEGRLEIQDAKGDTRLVYEPDLPPAVDPALLGSEWVLTSLDGAPPIEDTRISLAFDAESAGGFAGCNGYGGAFEVAEGGALRMGDMARQLRACQEPAGVMAQETSYLDALRAVTGYRVDGDRLELTDGAGKVRMAFVRRTVTSVDPAELIGTRWQVATIGKSRPIAGSTITLVFRDAHRFAGHAGCRGYVGGYEAQGDELGLVWLAMLGTEICAERADLLEQDQRYSTLLEGAHTYRLDGGRLAIETYGGEELTFVPIAADADAPLLGTTWRLIATLELRTLPGTDLPQWMPADPIPETAITATWDEGRVGGSAGCNTYSAAYSVEGEALSVGPAAATRMACPAPEGVMAQEQRFLAQLSASTRYRIDGPQLWLEDDAGGALVFAAGVADD
ncbi:MAG: META domain-containing protein [Anaerolineae bacterium]|nr:META domain-containing protein [Anaerolineae bacterium]